jgi:hypothetical protein
MPGLQPQLPQEIIDSIVNEFHGDITTLRQCALASKTFVRPSQGCLFHSIHLDRIPRARMHCQRLHQTLTESPHLAPFIRELYVMDGPFPNYSYSNVEGVEVLKTKHWIDVEIKFLLLFPMLPNLRFLSLSSYKDLDWNTLSEDFEGALVRVLGSVPKLKLSVIKNFPLAHFKNFYLLKNLTLHNFRVDSHRFMPTIAAPRKGHLEFFEFEFNDGMEQVIQELLHPTSSLTISQLRHLSIPGISPEMLVTSSKVIEASSHSLEALSLIIHQMGMLWPSYCIRSTINPSLA